MTVVLIGIGLHVQDAIEDRAFGIGLYHYPAESLRRRRSFPSENYDLALFLV